MQIMDLWAEGEGLWWIVHLSPALQALSSLPAADLPVAGRIVANLILASLPLDGANLRMNGGMQSQSKSHTPL
jgi:hypothetical protein